MVSEPHWRSEIRNIVGVCLGEASSICIIEAFAERESAITPAQHFFNVRHLQRYPRDLTYPEFVEDVRLVLQRISTDCEMVVDETLSGRQVSDLFRVIARPIRVNITNTGTEAAMTGSATYGIPLSVLLSNLDARLHCNELRLSKEIVGAVDLEASLKNLRDRASGSDIHADTLATALAVSLWRASTKRQKFSGSRSTPTVTLGYEAQKRKRGHPGVQR